MMRAFSRGKRKALLFPCGFPHKPDPIDGPAWLPGGIAPAVLRASEGGALGLQWTALQGVWFFFIAYAGLYSCGHEDTRRHLPAGFPLGRSQPGVRKDSNPTLHLCGVLQVIKHSHIQFHLQLFLMIPDLYFFLWLSFSIINIESRGNLLFAMKASRSLFKTLCKNGMMSVMLLIAGCEGE